MISNYAPDQYLAMELMARTLCDHMSESTLDAGYIFGQTADNQESSCQKAIELYKTRRIKVIIVCAGEARTGFCGEGLMREYLNKHESKWPPRKIILDEVPRVMALPLLVPYNQNLNMLTEAVGLVNYLKINGMGSVVVIAPPFCQLRAFITTISCATRQYPKLKVYSQPGQGIDWNQNVMHSQGVVFGTRNNLLKIEWDRLAQYHAKGDLVSCEEVLHYLDQRDARS